MISTYVAAQEVTRLGSTPANACSVIFRLVRDPVENLRKMRIIPKYTETNILVQLELATSAENPEKPLTSAVRSWWSLHSSITSPTRQVNPGMGGP